MILEPVSDDVLRPTDIQTVVEVERLTSIVLHMHMTKSDTSSLFLNVSIHGVHEVTTEKSLQGDARTLTRSAVIPHVTLFECTGFTNDLCITNCLKFSSLSNKRTQIQGFQSLLGNIKITTDFKNKFSESLFVINTRRSNGLLEIVMTNLSDVLGHQECTDLSSVYFFLSKSFDVISHLLTKHSEDTSVTPLHPMTVRRICPFVSNISNELISPLEFSYKDFDVLSELFNFSFHRLNNRMIITYISSNLFKPCDLVFELSFLIRNVLQSLGSTLLKSFHHSNSSTILFVSKIVGYFINSIKREPSMEVVFVYGNFSDILTETVNHITQLSSKPRFSVSLYPLPSGRTKRVNVRLLHDFDSTKRE